MDGLPFSLHLSRPLGLSHTPVISAMTEWPGAQFQDQTLLEGTRESDVFQQRPCSRYTGAGPPGWLQLRGGSEHCLSWALTSQTQVLSGTKTVRCPKGYNCT